MPVHVPWFEAMEDLFIGNPESGTMPVAAFRKGDRVTADLVEPNGWGEKVRVPDVFAPPPAPPAASESHHAPAKTKAAPAAEKE